jgi:hypothetical protein
LKIAFANAVVHCLAGKLASFLDIDSWCAWYGGWDLVIVVDNVSLRVSVELGIPKGSRLVSCLAHEIGVGSELLLGMSVVCVFTVGILT